jgi:CheY-like chemotaxis protein
MEVIMATILVVEDDMELLGLFQTVLENENYSVISATNGLQALDIVSNQTTPHQETDWDYHLYIK